MPNRRRSEAAPGIPTKTTTTTKQIRREIITTDTNNKAEDTTAVAKKMRLLPLTHDVIKPDHQFFLSPGMATTNEPISGGSIQDSIRKVGGFDPKLHVRNEKQI
ncbi:hypothetical protein GEV33_001252 [Tenebrio molitor]|jgi:hypothetical protein|uniref:Uncharacterized protein n=1 Tax=Tenebrio molitor TaxID=7067 RepID=A0A8J6HVN9_TENMO|nr:hypothetical protein GEV33_001252 [Tenebrio molitor]